MSRNLREGYYIFKIRGRHCRARSLSCVIRKNNFSRGLAQLERMIKNG